jgi:hypothetical protein
LTTAIVENAYDQQINETFGKIIADVSGLLIYAIVFTFFIVQPSFDIDLKVISKMNLKPVQKQLRFILISEILALIINLIMSRFMINMKFISFLAGFSLFGILTPWIFDYKLKIFEK